jgi:ribosomal protein L11 methyltransferase
MKNEAQTSHGEWWQLRVPVSAEIEEAMSNLLFDLGCSGCQQFENALSAFFPPDSHMPEIQRAVENYFYELRAMGFSIPLPKVELTPVAGLDWDAIWKRHFKPIFISDKLVIKPSWEPTPQTAAAVIEIDPKQAFGTGNHATTLMSLEFLAESVSAGQTLLDVGTGSGILAIAAIKLGADYAMAVDTDPVAIEAATENVHKNRVASKIDLAVGTVTAISPKRQFDCIVANINRLEIEKLISEFKELLTPRGQLFVTGMLLEDAAQLQTMAKQNGFSIQKELAKDEWMGAILKKESMK